MQQSSFVYTQAAKVKHYCQCALAAAAAAAARTQQHLAFIIKHCVVACIDVSHAYQLCAAGCESVASFKHAALCCECAKATAFTTAATADRGAAATAISALHTALCAAIGSVGAQRTPAAALRPRPLLQISLRNFFSLYFLVGSQPP
jgi:hypothetical protein